ncbi:putative LPS assembly protein LptD [Pedobacter foliorum]|uniref:putative LPS assembly protein LptD n=1 Tax=Pedobacter foliorum TaxID=2739058 RepID=UPI00156508FC|nr:putative LPS assembly protein LptD [Pedobacter foliorum]NRF38094.1 LPS-assembly protein LptD [Pedobacter foliorum]
MKLLRYIIFLNFLVLLTSVDNRALASNSFSWQQITKQVDTTKKGNAQSAPKDTVVSEKIEYSARDSSYFDKENEMVYLYGNARVKYQGIELDADYITYNSKTKLIYASGRTDAKGKYVGRPIFKMTGQSTSLADSIFYNTETSVGRIWGVFTEQEGGFFTGGKAKKQPDDEIHSKGQTYSTCNLPHPHFGIYITKGIVTEKQIITGPVYLKIEDIPLPIGLPFAFFPKPNKKSSGVILPSPGEDATRGFFLREGGYYLGLNDYWDAKMLATIYTRGSYEGTLLSNYTKRYKYNGNINFRYSNSRYGLEGTPEYNPRKDFNLQWTHTQNANARPGTTFSASVDAGTSSFNQNTAGGSSYDYNQFTKNTLRSSISYGKIFGNGITLGVAASGSQETQNKTVSLQLPDISLSVPTFNPFDSKDRLGEQKWYQKITVGYNMQASNNISTTEDQLFKRESLNKFKNGVSHQIPVNMAFNILDYFNFNTGVSYTERWQFQTIRKSYLKVLNSSDQEIIDTVPGFKRNGEYSLNMGVSTKIYSTAQFSKFGNFKALRHVMTPQVSFSYRPDFSDIAKGYYKNAFYTDGSPKIGFDGKQQKYSIFEGSPYGFPGAGRNASISFSLDNTVEAKVLTPKDTTGKGDKKIPIIQGLSISGSYNFLAPSFKLSTLGFSGRSQFTDKLGVNYYGTLDPYRTKDSVDASGKLIRVLMDDYVWNVGKLPRLTNFGFSFNYSLNPEALKKKNENDKNLKDKVAKTGMTPEQAEELAKVSRDPNAFVDFKIPWNFAFSYTFNYNTDRVGQNSTITNTLNFNGDANITTKWKVQFNSGWDFKASTFSQTSLSIYRDLHCWDMSFSWIPFGAYQFYSVDIKVKASVLQDLKLSKRKNYYTRY